MDEDLLGLIVSVGMTHWLAISPSRIAGRRGIMWTRNFCGFLGPGSTASEKDREEAQKVLAAFNSRGFSLFERLRKDKFFAFSKGSITRLDFKSPSLAHEGHLVIKTQEGERKVGLREYMSKEENNHNIINALVPSLVQFAPDRFYAEESGRLIADLLREGYRHQGAHGWVLNQP